MQLKDIYELTQKTFNIDFEEAVLLRDEHIDKDEFLIFLGKAIATKEANHNV